MLDPEIIKYVNTKCFHYFPSEGDQEDEWKECVKSTIISAKQSESIRQIMITVIKYT